MSGAYPLCPLLSHPTPRSSIMQLSISTTSCVFFPVGSRHDLTAPCTVKGCMNLVTIIERIFHADNRLHKTKGFSSFFTYACFVFNCSLYSTPSIVAAATFLCIRTCGYRFLPGCFSPLVSAVRWLFCNFSHYAWVFPCNCLDFPPYLRAP